MFLQRLRQLNLDKHFTHQGMAFQRAMGADLRALVFQYIKGELRAIPDGPAVKRFRDNIQVIGGMDDFVRTQSPNGAWATDIELTLLAELLDVNFVVEFAHTKRTAVLHASSGAERSTVSIVNTNNTQWDAIVSGKKDASTLHDGNCGYHAFARGVEVQGRKAFPVSSTSVSAGPLGLSQQIFHSQNSRYNRSIEEYRQDEARFQEAHGKLKQADPVKYTERMSQIESDYQYALKIALSDLPGVQGKPSQASATSHSMFAARHRMVRGITGPDVMEVESKQQESRYLRVYS